MVYGIDYLICLISQHDMRLSRSLFGRAPAPLTNRYRAIGQESSTWPTISPGVSDSSRFTYMLLLSSCTRPSVSAAMRRHMRTYTDVTTMPAESSTALRKTSLSCSTGH